jgi:hypothetical protein
MKKKWLFLNNLSLKIIACVAMTLDHLGIFLQFYLTDPAYEPLITAFRIIGRIALPIFIYLVFEGCRKTKNIQKYLMRLGIASLGLYLLIILTFVIAPNIGFNFGSGFFLENIFFTLFLLVLTYYSLFKNKGGWQRFLIIIPILFVVGGCIYEVACFNGAFNYKTAFQGFLDGIMPQYPFESLIMFLIVAISNYFYERNIKKSLGLEGEQLQAVIDSDQSQFYRNVMMVIATIIISLICEGLTYVTNIGPYVVDATIRQKEAWFLISSVFIIFYNGKLGPSNKITKYGFYIYYPVHIGLLALIFVLI